VVRFDLYRNEGRKACFLSSCPDAGVGVRGGEEGPPQQRGDQDDESDSDCINHEFT